MTRDRSQLINFIHKFLGTVKFDNDHVAKIMGYGEYKIRNVTISIVYIVEGLWHNSFSMGQFCDLDLKETISIRNLDGVHLHTGSRGNNLYTLSLGDMMAHGLVGFFPSLNLKRTIYVLHVQWAKGASWSTVVEEGEPVDLACSEGITSAIGAITSGARGSTLTPEVIAPIADVIPSEQAKSTGSPSSTTVDQDAPSPSKSQTTTITQSHVIPLDVEEDIHDIEVAHIGNDLLFGMPILEVAFDQSSSRVSPHIIRQPDHQIPQHNSKWSKDHPFDNIISQLSRPISTRLQLYE
nr:integrase, catalytic region, zinc finger, CCHC-type, peptidase aspartic, catalytic [Tanacetum cinerariifolium]